MCQMRCAWATTYNLEVSCWNAKVLKSYNFKILLHVIDHVLLQFSNFLLTHFLWLAELEHWLADVEFFP